MTQTPASLPPLPLPINPNGWSDDAAQVYCPLCERRNDVDDYDYVHLEGIRWLNQQEHQGFVDGATVRLHFWCENNGHHFSLDCGQHKGGQFVRLAPTWQLAPAGWSEQSERERCHECKAVQGLQHP